jgi:hypothetical protein
VITQIQRQYVSRADLTEEDRKIWEQMHGFYSVVEADLCSADKRDADIMLANQRDLFDK